MENDDDLLELLAGLVETTGVAKGLAKVMEHGRRLVRIVVELTVERGGFGEGTDRVVEAALHPRDHPEIREASGHRLPITLCAEDNERLLEKRPRRTRFIDEEPEPAGQSKPVRSRTATLSVGCSKQRATPVVGLLQLTAVEPV